MSHVRALAHTRSMSPAIYSRSTTSEGMDGALVPVVPKAAPRTVRPPPPPPPSVSERHTPERAFKKAKSSPPLPTAAKTIASPPALAALPAPTQPPPKHASPVEYVPTPQIGKAVVPSKNGEVIAPKILRPGFQSSKENMKKFCVKWNMDVKHEVQFQHPGGAQAVSSKPEQGVKAELSTASRASALRKQQTGPTQAPSSEVEPPSASDDTAKKSAPAETSQPAAAAPQRRQQQPHKATAAGLSKLVVSGEAGLGIVEFSLVALARQVQPSIPADYNERQKWQAEMKRRGCQTKRVVGLAGCSGKRTSSIFPKSSAKPGTKHARPMQRLGQTCFEMFRAPLRRLRRLPCSRSGCRADGISACTLVVYMNVLGRLRISVRCTKSHTDRAKQQRQLGHLAGTAPNLDSQYTPPTDQDGELELRSSKCTGGTRRRQT